MKYIIDEVLVSLLFNTVDTGKIAEIYTEIMSDSVTITKETLIKNLKDYDISEAAIDLFLENGMASPEFSNALKSSDAGKEIEENIQAMLGVIYKINIPQIPEANKLKIDQYLRLKNEDLKADAELQAEFWKSVLDYKTAEAATPVQVNLGGQNTNPPFVQQAPPAN